MHAAGHEVAAVATSDGIIWPALEHDGRVALYAADFVSKFHPPAMRTIRHAIQHARPDWIIGTFERDYWGTATVAAWHGVPCALFLHHAQLKYHSRYVLPRLVRRFLLPSQFLQRWIVAQGVIAKRTAVVHNPVDTNYFRPDKLLRETQRAALGLAADAVLIGYVGRFETNKGVIELAHALTQAMARVPTLHALWVGFGTCEPELQRIIHVSPFASRHVLRPWTDDVAACYAAMDVLALPSTGPEAFGRVLIEAQACGVPVLGSDIGGISETMNVGTTGQLVAPADANAWTDALCDLATNTARRKGMGSAAPAFVHEKFGSAVVAKQFEQLLLSVR